MSQSGVAVATEANSNRYQASGSYLLPAVGDARAWRGQEQTEGAATTRALEIEDRHRSPSIVSANSVQRDYPDGP
jgi:hypothetical protein